MACRPVGARSDPRSGPRTTPDDATRTVYAAFPVEEQRVSPRRTGKLCSRNREPPAEETYIIDLRPPTVDVQAALSVIGRRSKAQRDYEQERRDEAATGSKEGWRLDLTRSHLAGANLAGLNFDLARFDGSVLHFARCYRAHFSGASLLWAHLERAVLDCAHLEGARLSGASLKEAGLVGAHLEGALLENANLERAKCNGTHFEGTNLDSANFKRVTLNTATIHDAYVSNADLASANGLKQAQLDAAWGDELTQLPSNLVRPINERWLPTGANFTVEDHLFVRWQARRDYWVAEAAKQPQSGQTG